MSKEEFVVALSDNEIGDLKIAFILGEDGQNSLYQTRHYVGHVARKAVKVEIFSNEHPPPHFRVIYNGSTANYSITDGTCLNGSGEVMKYQAKIYKWWRNNKKLLKDKWNATRPTDCPVGPILDKESD